MATIHRFRANKNYRADIARLGNDIGRKIGEARREAKLTQSGLAKKLKQYGVSVQTPAVNKWESGENVPNAYQLMAIIHALGIKDGMAYFSGHVTPLTDSLNSEGRRIAKSFIEFLEGKEKYTRKKPRLREITVPTREIDRVSAGFGEELADEDGFEKVKYPESIVPDGTDFAVKVAGDSMEPAYHDGQVVFVESCETLNDGDVGILYYDHNAYIKVYREMMPSEEDIEDFTDDSGVIHPQIWFQSFNSKYPPIKIQDDFIVYGRVLN